MSRVRTLVATEFLMLAGLLAYVALAYAVERTFSLDGPVTLSPLAALLMASVPALLWLGYFHSQDRLEPEPEHYVLGAYLLGAFAAGPSAHFLVDIVTGPPSATFSFSALALERWVFAIALIGVAQELCKYVAVRYTLYLSPEFDEPIDGIVYMSAAGIGFATYESFQALQSSGGDIYLSAGAAQCVVTTLAHASFAGILGYVLGRAKFSVQPKSYRSMTIAMGLVAAALLNGTFHMVMDALSARGLSSSPWRRVFFSFGFAAAVFLLTSVLMRKLLLISPHREEHGESGEDSTDE